MNQASNQRLIKFSCIDLKKVHFKSFQITQPILAEADWMNGYGVFVMHH